MNKVAVVIPNWDGEDVIRDCLSSLLKQEYEHTVVVVDNGSVDSSVEIIESEFPGVTLLKQPKNLGFAGGVNVGIRYAINEKCDFVALLNNDATADKDWLGSLVEVASANKNVGAVMSKIISSDGKYLDGTGEVYTSWGIHYPRGRGEKAGDQYDKDVDIFGASGGASLFKIKALQEVGLFDEDFFAYYEDVDLNWRLQLGGWRVKYAPKAEVFHKISFTGGRIKGFTVYQTLKNLPWVVWKDLPGPILVHVLPRFFVAYGSFFASAVSRGLGLYALKGLFVSLALWPKKLTQRFAIQKKRKVSVKCLKSILVWDLPPDQHKLRRLRKILTRR